MKNSELNRLKREMQAIENYLGPKLDFCDDHTNFHREIDIYNPIVWMLKYLDVLKERYYLEIKKRKKFGIIKKIGKGIKRKVL
jgi:hypothetical protein